MRLIPAYLSAFCLAAVLSACSPIIRLLNSGESQTNHMPIAPRVVNASSAPKKALTANFEKLSSVRNPCGNFGGEIKFGASSDLLDVSCTPDMRTAVSNGNNGMFGVFSAPQSAPLRVAFNVADGRELGRLSSFLPCSLELDAFELSLGNGEAFFRCRPDVFSWENSTRLITKGQDQQQIELYLPYSSKYNYYWTNRRLVRQASTYLPPEPPPLPEIAVPVQNLNWQTWRFDPDPNICGSVVQETPDKSRLIALVGRIGLDAQSGDASYMRCLGEKLTFVSPDQNTQQAKFTMWLPGMISHTLYKERLLVVNRMSSSWNPKFPVANVQGTAGPELSFITGGGIAPWRYSGVSVIEGHGLIVLEVAPRVRLGNQPFLYIVFNWDGAPLARFYATRVALAPDRQRIVVTLGTAIETWDLK